MVGVMPGGITYEADLKDMKILGVEGEKIG